MPAKGDDIDVAVNAAAESHVYLDTVLITPKGYPHPSTKTLTLQGSFSNEYFDASGMATSQPNVELLTMHLADIAKGALVTIKGIKYIVTEVQPDGGGSTLLILQFA